jgi:hypothetical protein
MRWHIFVASTWLGASSPPESSTVATEATVGSRRGERAIGGAIQLQVASEWRNVFVKSELGGGSNDVVAGEQLCGALHEPVSHASLMIGDR